MTEQRLQYDPATGTGRLVEVTWHVTPPPVLRVWWLVPALLVGVFLMGCYQGING